MGSRIRHIKVCVNGGRGRGEHPAVPVSPAELAASAVAAVAAGAEAVHVHPRNSTGAESLLAADVGAAVTALRRACPGVPVGVSTGLWITGGDVTARAAAVTGWAGLAGTARPDFASANVCEPGLDELVGTLAAAGIQAEAGVWSMADAAAVAAAAPAGGWLRILVEIPDMPGARAISTAGQILRRLDHLAVTAPRLLHGEQDSCWPLLIHAAELGLPTRIGLEDTLTGPGGRPVTGNAHLVQLALALIRT